MALKYRAKNRLGQQRMDGDFDGSTT